MAVHCISSSQALRFCAGSFRDEICPESKPQTRNQRKFVIMSSMARDIPHSQRDDFAKRSRLSKAMKPLSVVEKAKNDILEFCSKAEGDRAYDCWQAYFQFLRYEEECQKEPAWSNDRYGLENLVRRSGGTKDLMVNLLTLSKSWPPEQGSSDSDFTEAQNKGQMLETEDESEAGRGKFPVPDELPKSTKDLVEDASVLMPESPYTSLLRRVARNISSPWYSHRPDHETD